MPDRPRDEGAVDDSFPASDPPSWSASAGAAVFSAGATLSSLAAPWLSIIYATIFQYESFRTTNPSRKV